MKISYQRFFIATKTVNHLISNEIFLKLIYQNLKLIIRSKNNEIENIIECYLLNGKLFLFYL